MCTKVCTKFSMGNFALADLETLAFLSKSRTLLGMPFLAHRGDLAHDLLHGQPWGFTMNFGCQFRAQMRPNCGSFRSLYNFFGTAKIAAMG